MHLSRRLVLSILALGLLLASPDAQGTALETTVSSSNVAAPPAPKDPVKDTVYITKTGKKYHRGNCRYLRKSKIAISRKKAMKRYKPCKVCKPQSGALPPSQELQQRIRRLGQ